MALGALTIAQAGLAEESLTILTGPEGNLYDRVGSSLAGLYPARLPVPAVTRYTGGAFDNVVQLQEGKGDFGLSSADMLIHAWDGNHEAGFRFAHRRLRIVAELYLNYLQIIGTTRSGVRTLLDLKGKRMSVGAPRTGAELSARALMTAAGLTYDDLNTVFYLTNSEAIRGLADGRLDAAVFSSGLGPPSIRELAQKNIVLCVDIPPVIASRMGAPFSPAVIPASVFPNQYDACPTATQPVYLITRADVPDAIVHEVTKALMEGGTALIPAYPSLGEITPHSAMRRAPTPLHPGAARYYREHGVRLADH